MRNQGTSGGPDTGTGMSAFITALLITLHPQTRNVKLGYSHNGALLCREND